MVQHPQRCQRLPAWVDPLPDVEDTLPVEPMTIERLDEVVAVDDDP